MRNTNSGHTDNRLGVAKQAFAARHRRSLMTTESTVGLRSEFPAWQRLIVPRTSSIRTRSYRRLPVAQRQECKGSLFEGAGSSPAGQATASFACIPCYKSDIRAVQKNPASIGGVRLP